MSNSGKISTFRSVTEGSRQHRAARHSSTNSSVSPSVHSHVPRTRSCPWETDVSLGIMATCHIFLSFTSCFVIRAALHPLSVCGVHVGVCLRVESRSRYLSENAVTTAPTPPPPPPSCSQPPHFFSHFGRNTEQG